MSLLSGSAGAVSPAHPCIYGTSLLPLSHKFCQGLSLGASVRCSVQDLLLSFAREKYSPGHKQLTPSAAGPPQLALLRSLPSGTITFYLGLCLLLCRSSRGQYLMSWSQAEPVRGGRAGLASGAAGRRRGRGSE